MFQCLTRVVVKISIVMCLLSCAFAVAATSPSQGDVLASNGNYTAAVKAFALAQKQSPENAVLAAKLAQANLLAGQHKQGVEWAKKAVALDPKSAGYRIILGNAYSQYVNDVGMFSKLGIAHKIRDSYKKAVALAPDKATTHFALGMFYVIAPGIAGGSDRKGEAQIARLAKLKPALADVARARVAMHGKDTAQAESWLRKAISVSHGEVGHMKLARLLAYQKHPQQALAEYRKAIAAKPKQAGPYYQIGKLAAQGKVESKDGIKALETYLGMHIDWQSGDPPFCWAHYRLAQIYALKGDKVQAKAEYQQALALNPHFEQAQKALARMRRAQDVLQTTVIARSTNVVH